MNLNKEFEYEVSCVFRCWGDKLNVHKLKNDLRLSDNHCLTVIKGEGIGKIGDRFRGIAKTSQLSYKCLDEFPDWNRLPYKQIEHICNALSDVTLSSYDAQNAELQISYYYQNKLEDGECALYFDGGIFKILSKNNISLRQTILP